MSEPRAMSPQIGTQPLRDARKSQYRVLFNFDQYKNARHGRNPVAPLLYLNGALYGTSAYGGDRNGVGTAFGIDPDGLIKVLHVFQGGPGGNEPFSGLTLVSGILYGTTYEGGTYGYGTIFRLTTSGQYRMLYSFNFANSKTGSAGPLGNLVDVNGTLYGTAISGASCDCGVVYSVSTKGEMRILHYFSGPDGSSPMAGLLNVSGILYGTTSAGGTYNKGTVFRISTSGAEKVLFSFKGHDGAYPEASLVAVSGKLYGTTTAGGSRDSGIVFRMTTGGNEFAILHSFSDENGDGAHPAAGLIDVGGVLYGTTAYGGVSGPSAECHAFGCGIIYSITKTGTETVIHRFQQSYESDGSIPMANLIEVNGKLYGTTEFGGSTPACQYSCDDGTVFQLDPMTFNDGVSQ
jgi:uncharacterized repeat protein (TIGR03803 family)